MKQAKNTIYSQLSKALEVLKDMKDNITASDREAARGEFGISLSTISEYLNGNGLNLDRAMDLIQFFNQRIEVREDILKDMLAA